MSLVIFSETSTFVLYEVFLNTVYLFLSLNRRVTLLDLRGSKDVFIDFFLFLEKGGVPPKARTRRTPFLPTPVSYTHLTLPTILLV